MPKAIGLILSELSLEMLNEIREVTAKREGSDPGAARTIRIAIAEMHQRLVEAGQIKAAK